MRIGAYTLSTKLGEGGMGTVYKAHINVYKDENFLRALRDTELPQSWMKLRQQMSGIIKEEFDHLDFTQMEVRLNERAANYEAMTEEAKNHTYRKFCAAMKEYYRYKQLPCPLQYLLPDIWRAIKICDTEDRSKFKTSDSAESAKKRFTVETAVRLPHRNIVQTVDHGTDDHILYGVMEYVENAANLSQQQVTPHEAISAGIQTLDGLIIAHENGVIHRDIKPGNIIYSKRTGLAKICDFGIMKLMKAEDDLHVTKEGEVIGSPYYLSPEQAHGEIGVRADVYGLGATLTELLTGSPIATGTNPVEVLMKKIRDDVLWVRDRNKDISKEVEDIVKMMLSVNEQERLSTYEARELLKEVLTQNIVFEYDAEKTREEQDDSLARRVDEHKTEESRETILQRIKTGLMRKKKIPESQAKIAESYENWAAKTTDSDEIIRLLFQAKLHYESWITQNWGMDAMTGMTSTWIEASKEDIKNDVPVDYARNRPVEAIGVGNINDRKRLIEKRIALEKSRKKRQNINKL